MRVRKVFQLVLPLCWLSVSVLWGLDSLPTTQGPLTMKLVYPANGLGSGTKQKVWVGWHIERDHGWHTYWKHPGDVGIPPQVKWDLPAGCEAGEIVFPPPKRVSMAGISAQGHHGKTLFLIPFYFSDIPEDQHEIHLTGRFSWMACSRICMPSTTKLSLTIPVVREPLADLYLAEKFKRFWQKQPQDLPDSWEFQAFSMGKFINLRFPRSLSKNTNRMEFFGEDRTVLSNQIPKVRNTGDRLEWLFQQSPWKKSSPDTLAGLLAIGEGDDIAYYRLKVPVLPAQ